MIKGNFERDSLTYLDPVRAGKDTILLVPSEKHWDVKPLPNQWQMSMGIGDDGGLKKYSNKVLFLGGGVALRGGLPMKPVMSHSGKRQVLSADHHLPDLPVILTSKGLLYDF